MTHHPRSPGLALALRLAEAGWHIFPLAWRDKRPLGNCQPCRNAPGPLAAHIQLVLKGKEHAEPARVIDVLAAEARPA